MNNFKPMRKLLLKVKQSTAWRVLCRACARWAEEDANERAAAFAYYLLLFLRGAGGGPGDSRRFIATNQRVRNFALKLANKDES